MRVQSNGSVVGKPKKSRHPHFSRGAEVQSEVECVLKVAIPLPLNWFSRSPEEDNFLNENAPSTRRSAIGAIRSNVQRLTAISFTEALPRSFTSLPRRCVVHANYVFLQPRPRASCERLIVAPGTAESASGTRMNDIE